MRVGLALFPDVVSVVLTHTLLHTHKNPPNSLFHPVYALTQSLILPSLYIISLSFNAIIVYSNESQMDNRAAWERLCYSEMALQGLLVVCWGVMVVCSCVAVHKWRGVKVEAKVRGLMREELELKNVEDRRDSANVGVDAERDGLVQGSVKSLRVFV